MLQALAFIITVDKHHISGIGKSPVREEKTEIGNVRNLVNALMIGHGTEIEMKGTIETVTEPERGTGAVIVTERVPRTVVGIVAVNTSATETVIAIGTETMTMLTVIEGGPGTEIMTMTALNQNTSGIGTVQEGGPTIMMSQRMTVNGMINPSTGVGGRKLSMNVDIMASMINIKVRRTGMIEWRTSMVMIELYPRDVRMIVTTGAQRGHYLTSTNKQVL